MDGPAVSINKDDKQANVKPLRAFSLSFLPPLIIRNTLPCALRFKLGVHNTCEAATKRDPAMVIAPGASLELCCINVSKEKALIFHIFPPDAEKESTEVSLLRQNRHTQQMDIAARGRRTTNQSTFRVLFTVTIDMQCGQMTVEASSPCWVVNKSGLPLEVSGTHSLLDFSHAQPGLISPSSRGVQLPASLEMPLLLGHARAHLLLQITPGLCVRMQMLQHPSALRRSAFIRAYCTHLGLQWC